MDAKYKARYCRLPAPFLLFLFFICLFCGVGDGDGDGAKICLHEIEPWEARPIHPQALPSQSPLLESCGWPLQINWDRSGSERVAGGAGILPLAQSQPPRSGERELLSGTRSAIRSKADGTGHMYGERRRNPQNPEHGADSAP